jgi:hypothetical protein
MRPTGETLNSVGNVSQEQQDRAALYVLEEADLRFPEEDQAEEKQAWMVEVLGALGLDQPS